MACFCYIFQMQSDQVGTFQLVPPQRDLQCFPPLPLDLMRPSLRFRETGISFPSGLVFECLLKYNEFQIWLSYISLSYIV